MLTSDIEAGGEPGDAPTPQRPTSEVPTSEVSTSEVPALSASAQAIGERKTASINRIARNFLSLSVAALAERVIALFSGIYARNVLQSAAIGQLSWTSAIITYVSLLVSPGLQVIAKREVARDPKKCASYVALLFLIQMSLAVAAFALVWAFGASIGRGPQIHILLLLNAVGLLLLPLDLSWLLQAHERAAPLAFTSVALLLAQGVALLALIHGPGQLLLYVLLPYPFRLAQIAFIIGYALRHKLFDWRDLRFNFGGARVLVRDSVPVGLTQVAVLLYGNSDLIFLGFTQTSATVGLYDTAYRMMLVPTFLHAALTNAFFPALSRSFSDAAAATRVSRQFLRLMIWLGFPLAALGWAVGRYFIFALFRADFAPSGALLEWLSLNLALMFFNVGYILPLIAWEHQGKAFRCTLAGAAVNVALNFWLIPHLGVWGAVISTVAAEAAVFLCVVQVRRSIYPLAWPMFVLKPLAVCLLAAPLTRLSLAWLPWWCAAFLGIVFCACGCALVESDWRRAAITRLRNRAHAAS